MPGEQLDLSIQAERRRLPHRLSPMQATPIDEPFDDPDYLFEPWWPGVRALAFVEGGTLRLQAEGLSDALAALPELADLPKHVRADGVVLDGTLLVLDDEGLPDASLLRRRLSGAGRPGRAAFVAADLLYLAGASLARRAYRFRRARLREVLVAGDRVTVGEAYPREGMLVADALRGLGIAAISARQLSSRHRAGAAGAAWLRAPLEGAVATERPRLALIQRLPLD